MKCTNKSSTPAAKIEISRWAEKTKISIRARIILQLCLIKNNSPKVLTRHEKLLLVNGINVLLLRDALINT